MGIHLPLSGSGKLKVTQAKYFWMVGLATAQRVKLSSIIYHGPILRPRTFATLETQTSRPHNLRSTLSVFPPGPRIVRAARSVRTGRPRSQHKRSLQWQLKKTNQSLG